AGATGRQRSEPSEAIHNGARVAPQGGLTRGRDERGGPRGALPLPVAVLMEPVCSLEIASPMTSREKTAFLALDDGAASRPFSEKLFTVAWGAIQWPWLARSLWGGRL